MRSTTSRSTGPENADSDTKVLPAEFTDARWHAPAGEIAGRRVELTRVGDTIALRDSASPDGPYLLFDSGEWEAFLAGVKLGEFDATELAKA